MAASINRRSRVLLDDDFSSIARAVRLGRRIYDNIEKATGEMAR